jgi:uncharacterized protein
MDVWHFPRPELAKHYLTTLELGISSSLALIAPRRKGKTLFILQDLAPAAHRGSYLPVYASFWQNINAPHEGLIQALEEALEMLDKKATFSRLLNAKIKKTTVSNELLGKMEVEFAEKPAQINSQQLGNLDKLLTELESKVSDKTVLLLIDEVQHLATSNKFDPLTHVLRTMLDKRQGRVKAIFTGSSRHYMNLLLNESQSPFYHFVETVPFPDLDESFIEFIRQRLAEEHHTPIALQSLNKAFMALDQSPYWMMKLIANMVTFRMSVEAAQEHVLNLMEAAEGFEAIAGNLKTIDKIVFLALCEKRNPFSKDLMEQVDQQTDVKGVPSNIQRSIQRLSDTHLVSQVVKGQYFIEKPGLRRYLQSSGSC